MIVKYSKKNQDYKSNRTNRLTWGLVISDIMISPRRYRRLENSQMWMILYPSCDSEFLSYEWADFKYQITIT